MAKISEFLVSCLLNSLWQIPILYGVAAVGCFLLRNCSASYRHAVWVGTLGLCLVAPIVSSIQIVPRLTRTVELSSVPSSDLVPQIGKTVGVDATDATPFTGSYRSDSPVSLTTTPRNIQLLTIGYAMFVMFATARFGRLWIKKEKLRRSVALDSLPADIDRVVQQCRNVFGISSVQIAHSDKARVPYTLGVRKPLIVLPEAFYRNINPEILLAVMAHEMAHVCRRDFLSKLLCEFVSLPICFHPVTFFIKRRIDRERELACDELVTRHVLKPETYARSLLCAADLSLLPAPTAVMLGIFDGRILEKRIMQLKKNKLLLSRRAARTITASILLSLSVLTVSVSIFAVELQTQLDAPLLTRITTLTQLETEGVAPIAHQDQTTLQFQQDVRAKTPQERSIAACSAARNRNLEAIPYLTAMLEDETRTELVKCWDGSRWSPALETFKQPSPGEQAALALASMGRPAFMPLVRQLNNPSSSVRRNAAWAIGELTNMLPGERADAIPQLVTLLSDSDVWVRIAAARAIGEVRDLSSTETLIVSLSDADGRVRQMSAWALSELKDERSVQALCNLLLADANAEVRREVARALGEIRSAEALPYLRQAATDPHELVRSTVEWAIAEIEDVDG